MTGNSSALSLDAKIFLHDIEKADILVGIPSFNNVLTASFVLSQAVKGLDTYFPNLKSVIFVSDGNSKDDTLNSVKKINLPSEVKLIPAIYMGLSGKGTAVKAIFEAANYLKVKSVALVDSDLRSITPEWMQLLIAPTLEGTGFVAPYYNRRKYDGTITDFLCYPVISSLFGKEIRQPIGGDFGLSIDLVKDILDSPLWSVADVDRFGIDIFETCTALAKGYKVKQARLGVKNHDAKDPSSQLTLMFHQVVNAMFSCIELYEPVWKETTGVAKVEMFGEAKYGDAPEPVEVSLSGTVEAFKSSYQLYQDVYSAVLEEKIHDKFEAIKQIENLPVDFSSEIWAKTVYSFIAQFHKNPVFGRERLIDALRALWIGRFAVFIKETLNQTREQAEHKINLEAEAFKKQKPYLTEKY